MIFLYATLGIVLFWLRAQAYWLWLFFFPLHELAYVGFPTLWNQLRRLRLFLIEIDGPTFGRNHG